MLLKYACGGVVPSAKGACLKFLKEEKIEGAQHPKIMEAGMRMENVQVRISGKNTISYSKQTYTKYCKEVS